MKNTLCIKKFFKANGLNWTGLVCGEKEDEFRPATEEDFENLSLMDYLIDFGKDGQIALNVEIDTITFKINGESNDCALSCYAGDKEENLKLCEERDLSNNWIHFQLSSKGLSFAITLREKINEARQKVVAESETRIKRIEKKIKFLTIKVEDVKEEQEQKLEHLSQIEKSIEYGTENIL